MNSGEIYQSLLEDTQASLAAALSRIEVLKSRQRHLIQENNKLKQTIREAGIPQPVLLSTISTISSSFSVDPSQDLPSVPAISQNLNQQQSEQQQQVQQQQDQRHVRGVSDGVTEEEFVDVLRISDEDSEENNKHWEYNSNIQPIVVIGEQSENPGYVLIGADQLEFLEVVAVVPSKDYVGVCPLPSPKDAEGYIRRKWWQSLDPINSTPKHSDWTTYLTRTSWTSQIDHQQVLVDLAKEQSRYADSDYRGIVWKDVEQEGRVKAFDFRASKETRRLLQEKLDMWTGTTGTIIQSPPPTQHMEHDEEEKWLEQNQNNQGKLQPARSMSPKGDVFTHIEPVHLEPCKATPNMVDSSNLLSELHARCLNNHLPGRHRFSSWELIYSTARHGISLQTLYRRELSGRPPTILIIRDNGGYVFGCFTSEQWKVHPRYYGSGETFVFQLTPHLIAYDWVRKSLAANEYFQYAQSDSLGVGGGPHFALWLDGDLARGSSGTCATFGSVCLASQEDFSIMEVEVWTLR